MTPKQSEFARMLEADAVLRRARRQARKTQPTAKLAQVVPARKPIPPLFPAVATMERTRAR